MPNNQLAERVGLAPSTCHGRVRALERAGVITGYHAAISPAAIGRSVMAVISLRVVSRARNAMVPISEEMARLPGVLSVFLLTGERDLLVHVACGSTHELRDFIAEHLAGDARIENTQTQIVFDHLTHRA